MDIEYRGDRSGNHFDVGVWVWNGEKAEPLEHLVRHSPTGFEWGYQGSGPADLARSILADYLTRTLPENMPRETLRDALYQNFKAQVIAGITTDTWVIYGWQIRTWLVITTDNLIAGEDISRSGGDN